MRIILPANAAVSFELLEEAFRMMAENNIINTGIKYLEEILVMGPVNLEKQNLLWLWFQQMDIADAVYTF